MKKKKVIKHPKAGTKNLPVPGKDPDPQNWKVYFALAFILLISFIAYSPVLHNGLLGWDDDNYIKNNSLIYSINLKEIFSQYVMGNYHPITILTLAIEYHFFGLNETGYHTINLLLHLLNVTLVFYTVFLISDKAGVALVASLLFGIHPIHVESVAWAAELKDLLYAFFFLVSYIFYLNYIKKLKRKFYFFALLVFLFALFSKAMAVSLPVVLLLTDYFKERKITINTLLEKLPFFLLSLAFGVVAVFAQKSSDAIQVFDFTLPQRIVFACYGFITYLYKLLLPISLYAFYPYPVKNGNDIPFQFYLYILFFLGLAVTVFYSLRFTRKIVFGFGFFAVTIFLVLQLLPVGMAIMADRYCYLPSIGIFYLAGELFIFLWRKKLKLAPIVLLSAFTIFFSVKTYAVCGVWKNDLTLWNDAIRQDQTIPIAYYNRANIFRDENKIDEAFNDYDKAIKLKPDFIEAYVNRGAILRKEKKFDEALNDFNKAIELKPDYTEAYVNRGALFQDENKIEEALNDFNKAIKLKPDLALAYVYRGILLTYEKKNDLAFDDYSRAIELKPDFIEAYYNRANLFRDEKKMNEAVKDYSKAIELKPDFIEAYVNRGALLRDGNKIEEALKDFNKAIELKPDFAIAYFNRGALFMNQKKYDEAISDFSSSIELNAGYVTAYYNRGLAEYYSGKKVFACRDLKQAASLGYQPAEVALFQFCK